MPGPSLNPHWEGSAQLSPGSSTWLEAVDEPSWAWGLSSPLSHLCWPRVTFGSAQWDREQRKAVLRGCSPPGALLPLCPWGSLGWDALAEGLSSTTCST